MRALVSECGLLFICDRPGEAAVPVKEPGQVVGEAQLVRNATSDSQRDPYILVRR